MDCPSVSACSFRFNEKFDAMVTQVMTKVPLSMREDKRFWFCKDKSVGYGHWLAYQGGYRDGDVVCVRGGQIAPLDKNALPTEIEVVDSRPEDIELYNTLYGLMVMSDQNDSDFSIDINTDFNGDGPEIIFGHTCHISEPISRNSQKGKRIVF